MQVLFADKFDQQVVDTLQRNGTEPKHIGNGVGRGVNICKADCRQNALLRTRNQIHGCFEDGHARRFGAYQRLRDVEAVFRQQIVQVLVPGHPPRDTRIARTNEVRVPSSASVELSVYLRATPTVGDDFAKCVVIGRADGHSQSVVGDDVQGTNVVGCASCHDRMHAARVVADHAAERVVIVGCRVRAEGQSMMLRRIAEMIEYAAGLDASAPGLRVERNDTVEVLAKSRSAPRRCSLARRGSCHLRASPPGPPSCDIRQG